MEIQTKFKLGEMVSVLENNQIFNGKIVNIYVKMEDGFKGLDKNGKIKDKDIIENRCESYDIEFYDPDFKIYSHNSREMINRFCSSYEKQSPYTIMDFGPQHIFTNKCELLNGIKVNEYKL
jgi:hypothetical protein